jgi:hypothetical protein
MEPDISILRKTGHFYFAVTRIRMPGSNGAALHALSFEMWHSPIRSGLA